jgi:N,N'-diacetylbacillosaminyl-diphospho-undecaprenol alpha-1,3-N-acetylgalactosaminyltransferase
MKIAVICPDDLSVVLFCRGLIFGLRDDGKNKVFILSDPDISGQNRDGHYTDIIKSWGIERREIKFSRFINPVSDISYIRSLFRTFRDERFDMVVNISTKPNMYGTFAARLAGIDNIVCSVWGMGLVFAEDGDLRRVILQRLVEILYRLAFACSRKVWFTNRNDAEYFLERGIVSSTKLIQTKNYVNTEDYSPTCVNADEIANVRKELKLNDSDQVIVMVARMSWAKGVREFAEAAGIMRATHPHVRFILVGPRDDGSLDSVPESYLREQEQYDNFQWLGFRKDVKILYALSALAVLPTYYREGGYPRGLTEPMAMGKPVVTTESVHCRGTVEDGKNGYIIPVKDSQALAKAISDLIDDDEKMKRFGMYSRMKVLNEFSEDVIIKELMHNILN